MNRRDLIGGVGLSFISMPAWANSRRHQAPVVWPDGCSGGVSLTYDDGLDSQLDAAQPALEQRGMRGTFYVTMRNIDRRLGEWEAAAARGHELANHTMSHACDLQRFKPEQFFAIEVAPMEAWLRRVTSPARIPTYAYPCDVTNLGPGDPNQQARRYERLLRRNAIAAARTSEGAPNNPPTALHRAYRIQALAVGYDAPDEQAVIDYLATAARRGHWAVLVFHRLVETVKETGEVSVEMHSRILDGLGALGLWCAPVGRMFDFIRSQIYD